MMSVGQLDFFHVKLPTVQYLPKVLYGFYCTVGSCIRIFDWRPCMTFFMESLDYLFLDRFQSVEYVFLARIET